MNRGTETGLAIRDIRFIYLYEMPYSTPALPYYGLKILMGKSRQAVTYSHKNTIFPAFVRQVYQTYHLEKNQGKHITLLGECTQRFLNEQDFIKESTLIHIEDHIAEADAKYPLGDAFVDTMLAYAVSKLAKVCLQTLAGNSQAQDFELRPGYKDRKSLQYRQGESRKVLPVSLIEAGVNCYQLQFFYGGAIRLTVSAEIRLTSQEIAIDFTEKRLGAQGHLQYGIVYQGDQVNWHEVIEVLQQGAPIRQDRRLFPAEPLDAATSKWLLAYLAMANAAFDVTSVVVYRINADFYFIDDLLGDRKPQEQMLTDVSALMVVGEKSLAIKYSVINFIYQSQYALKQVLDEVDVDVVYQMVESPAAHGNYVVCQRTFHPTPNGNHTYQAQYAGMVAEDLYQVPYPYRFPMGPEAFCKCETPSDYRKQPFRMRWL